MSGRQTRSTRPPAKSTQPATSKGKKSAGRGKSTPPGSSKSAQEEPANSTNESDMSSRMDEILSSKLSLLMQQLKGDIVAELKQANEQGSEFSQVNDSSTSRNSGHSKKRKTTIQASSENETSEEELDSDQSPESRNRKKTKQKSKVSRIEVVSASEDEDWSRSCSKFGFLVGHNVTEKLKLKIQSDKFVEMADLMPSSDDHKNDLILKNSDEGVRFVNARKRKYMSIENWNQAFGVYMSVYIETASSLAEAILLMKQMLTYQRNINLFARRRESWYLYDKYFRKDRESSSSPTLFSDIRHDLILDLNMQAKSDRPNFDQDKPFRRSFRSFDRNFNGSRGGKFRNTSNAACFLFNDQHKRCERSRCQFKHNCSKCGGRHPRFLCDRATAAAENLDRLQNSASARQTPSNQHTSK
jgi:hypothetical protein